MSSVLPFSLDTRARSGSDDERAVAAALDAEHSGPKGEITERSTDGPGSRSNARRATGGSISHGAPADGSSESSLRWIPQVERATPWCVYGHSRFGELLRRRQPRRARRGRRIYRSIEEPGASTSPRLTALVLGPEQSPNPAAGERSPKLRRKEQGDDPVGPVSASDRSTNSAARSTWPANPIPLQRRRTPVRQAAPR